MKIDYATFAKMSPEQQKAAIEALNASQSKPQTVSLKVSAKGALSLYGLGRFPVTLYRSQWERLAAEMPKVTAFITANSATLKVKE